jgi:hypothetical protein
MRSVDQAFTAMSDLRLWFKIRNGQSLVLSDISELIPLRWDYFRDNWEFIKDKIRDRRDLYNLPDQLENSIIALSRLIEVQRNNQNVNPFDKSQVLTQYYAVFDNMFIESIPLTKKEIAIINKNKQRVSAFIKTDFINIRVKLTTARDEIADTVGGTDSTYNTTYQRSPAPALKAIKISDIYTMKQLQDSIKVVDFILANAQTLTTSSIDPFALAKANANNPNFDMGKYKSGTLVKLNYGESLQSLANRYLGDSDKWIDIAIANGLQAPFIDEVGESLPLIANGSNNQINISATDLSGNRNIEKFYIQQVIFLQSNTYKFPDQRTILNIKQIPISGEIVLELSGDTDMSKYTTADSASVRIFKPNTANSNFFILIPNLSPPSDQVTLKTPFFMNTKGEDEKRAGIDLLLDANGDVIFSSSGDLQLSYGVANSIQAIQLKLANELGNLSKHPDFGLVAVQGQRNSNTSVIKDLLTKSINDMISSDPRFDRVEQLIVYVDKTINAAVIKLTVRMAGTGSLIPISFSINTH